MRLVFLGTPEMAVPGLEALVAAGHDVRLVVSQPDRARDRGQALQPTPVHAAADRLGLPCIQPAKIRTAEFREQLETQDAAAFIVVAYGRIIPDELLALAPHRWINMHPSLLPLYRGPAPVQGPLFNGDTVTGVTTIQLVSEMDAGDILLQRETPIAPDETAGELHDRLAVLGAKCLVETLARLENDAIVPKPQDHAKATYTHKLSKADGILDCREPALTLANRTRAVTPWPGATVTFGGQSWKLWRVESRAQSSDAAPGTIIDVSDDGIVVACGEGRLVILELQRPGKQRMDVRAFLRGHPVAVGAQFSLPADG